MPIKIEKITYLEKKKEEFIYGREELKDLLISELENQFRNDEIDKLNIVNKVVNIYDKENGKLEVEMTYEIIENIGIENKIDLSE